MALDGGGASGSDGGSVRVVMGRTPCPLPLALSPCFTHACTRTHTHARAADRERQPAAAQPVGRRGHGLHGPHYQQPRQERRPPQAQARVREAVACAPRGGHVLSCAHARMAGAWCGRPGAACAGCTAAGARAGGSQRAHARALQGRWPLRSARTQEARVAGAHYFGGGVELVGTAQPGVAYKIACGLLISG